jgi:hypothetical protein
MNANLQYLAATTDLPLATPRGRLLTRHGYDSETCLYLALPRDAEVIVPNQPTPDEVRAAVAVLMRPWRAYQFAGPDDAAGLVSGVIAAVGRPVLGLCPAYLVDASTQGAGKTKAATALGAVIEGRRPAVTPFAGTSTDDELRKRFLASAVDGVRFACIDNLIGHFKSASLASVLTTGRLSDRILGQSRTVDASVCSLLTMTSNNSSLDADLQRRTVAVRIDAGANPTHRAFDFDPVSEALAQRHAIAEAACVVWRAYFNAGAPDIVKGDAGGFADWNRLCRQPVHWLAREGLADALPWQLGDPAASMLADTSASDPELEVLGDLLRALHALGDEGDFAATGMQTWFRAGEHDSNGAFALLRSAISEILGLRRGDEPSTRSLGRMLMNRRDRVVGGLVLRARKVNSANACSWRVVQAG